MSIAESNSKLSPALTRLRTETPSSPDWTGSSGNTSHSLGLLQQAAVDGEFIFGGKKADLLVGKNGDDFIFGNDGNDFLFGQGGKDYLSGGFGNDYLSGGGGADRLNGGSGADTLVSQGDGDRLVGGTGGDVFEFAEMGQGAVIKDFEDGTDLIDLTALVSTFNELVITDTSYGAVVGVAGGQILLHGVSAADLSEDDFDGIDAVPFAPVFELSSLDGTNGFVINGIDADDRSGHSVSAAGDVNGDGIDDLIIGAPLAAPGGIIEAGETYVVFGSDTGFDASLDLSTLDGANGFVINGIDEDDNSGYSVSGAGDVNGDGIDDVIIGTYYAETGVDEWVGESYVVFGSDTGFDATLDLSSLDGTNGFVINGIDDGDLAGNSVSGAGDINGDGIDDVLIGAIGAYQGDNRAAGESYVIFGSDTGFDATLDLSSLDGTNGFVINGIDENDLSGHSVSGAGDVNGDGIDDLIIGAPLAAPGGVIEAGETYVVFGSDTGFDATLDLSSVDGTNGFVINGIDQEDYSGTSVSAAGDVNGDGIDDLIIGAYEADPGGNDGAGETYVVFGSDTGFDASLDLSTLDGTNGFVINGVDQGDHSGISVSGAGDVNGDGIDDVIVGAYGADETYIIFGRDTFDAEVAPVSTSFGDFDLLV